MAVYKIFPEKSATLYSYYPNLNSGQDEILELSTYKSITGTNEVSRPLIKFPTDQINDIIDNKISGASYDTYLKMYLSNASELPVNYTVFCYALTQDWNVGTGRLGNSPITTNGVSWIYTNELNGNVWTDTTFQSSQTGSYSPDGAVGGGTWWDYPSLQVSQSFNNISSKDIEIKVTDIVDIWYDNGIYFPNYGFILKHSSSLEFTDAPKFELKYFSGTTHTIYPPSLEFRWDDSIYNTGSLNVVTSSLFALTLGNNKGEFQQDSIQRFRVNVRDIYPSVAFRTSISYANAKALPSSSYWSIKDLDTEEIVVDYDTSYTKISCDPNGNYFDVYMNGLEPERYYKLLIKTIVENKEVVISDKDYIFKVIR
jgi:hypothetical protein